MPAPSFGRAVHVSLAAPTAAVVPLAVAVDHLVPARTTRDALFLGLTAGAGLVAVALVAWTVVLHRARRRAGTAVRGGSRSESALAFVTGAALGAFAGTMMQVEVGGLHFSTALAYFLLIPVALMVCCPRRPAWRPFVDVTLLMAGVELGAQLGASLTKWGRLRWWDDVTNIDLAWWAGGTAVAALWALWTGLRGGAAVREGPRRVDPARDRVPTPRRPDTA